MLLASEPTLAASATTSFSKRLRIEAGQNFSTREPNIFNILLVDDSATDRILLTGLLRQHEHFEIDTAEDGAIAFAKMQGELRSVVKSLKEQTTNPAVLHANEKEFTELLRVFRDQLAFRFEALGCFEEAVEAAPQTFQQSQRLRGQHTELHERAKKLSEEAASSATCDLESLAKNVRDLLQDFDGQEAAENEMIVNAMFEDIGGSG